MVSASTRVVREEGTRVTTNVSFRDLVLPVPAVRGARRLEIAADGLRLISRAQLAFDAEARQKREEKGNTPTSLGLFLLLRVLFPLPRDLEGGHSTAQHNSLPIR